MVRKHLDSFAAFLRSTGVTDVRVNYRRRTVTWGQATFTVQREGSKLIGVTSTPLS